MGAALERHPLPWSVVLTVIWLVVVHLLAQLLVAGRTGTYGDLRAAAVNVGALLVPLIVIVLAGWRLRAGLSRGQRWYLLVPIALIYASVLLFGVESQTANAVLAVALLQLMLGLNEEVMFRGLVQGIWARQAPVTQCTAVALVFGLQHSANLLWGQSLFDTAAQVFSATITGFAFAATRLHVGSIWGLALVHGFGNLCNDISSNVPLVMSAVVDVLIFAYGIMLVRAAAPRAPVHNAT